MTAVPSRFPFPGSGPSRDYRYDLVDYSPRMATTAESWQRLHDASVHLEGMHKREFPKIVVNEVLYGGGAHKLANFYRIYLGAYATALECALYMEQTSLDYTFTLSESAGANTVTIICPYSGSNGLILLKDKLELTTSGWTNVSISGDALAASHPTLLSFGCRIVQDRRI